MSFAEILADLAAVQDLAKSLPAAGGDEKTNTEGAVGAAIEGELLGKSFQVQTESGETIEAVDGTELVKSLIARLDQADVQREVQENDLTKSLGVIKDAMLTQTSVIKAQGELIKSLQDQLASFGSAGAGRKSVVTVNDKPEPLMVKSEQNDGVPAQEFMAKAMTAQDKGLITSRDVSVIELSLQKGVQVPAALVQKVMG